jgi:large subunit ribosomal protein L10
MGVTRQKKEAIVATLVNDLGGSGSIVLADVTGINVAEMTELRNNFREAGVSFTIVKNTLLKRVFDSVDVSENEPVYALTQGPTAIAFGKDEVAPVRILKKFAMDHKGLPSIKGGYVSGESLSMEQMLDLADMPGRDELLAKLLGSMKAPLQGFVSVSSGLIRKLLYALNAIRENSEK